VLATGQLRVLSEQIALSQGSVSPGAISAAARSFQIIPKVEPFAGKQFDAVATSNNLELEVLLRSLTHALKAAGWIEVDRRDAGDREQATAGSIGLVRI